MDTFLKKLGGHADVTLIQKSAISLTAKSQIKPKADWRAIDSPKKRRNEFVCFFHDSPEILERDHPFKTSTLLRGGGVKNLPNLPTDSSKKLPTVGG